MCQLFSPSTVGIDDRKGDPGACPLSKPKPWGHWPCGLPQRRTITDARDELCAQELVGNLGSRSVASSLGRELGPAAGVELCSCTYVFMCTCTLYMHMLLCMSVCRLRSTYLEGEVMVSDISEVLCLYVSLSSCRCSVMGKGLRN